MLASTVCGVGARGQEEYKESERSLAASAAAPASGNDFFWSVGTEQVCMFKGNCNGRETEALTEFGEYGWEIRQHF